MSQNKPMKYQESQVAKAKKLYLQYTPVTEIAKQSGLSTSAVNYYAKNYWLAEREERKNAIINEFSSKKKLSLTKIVSDGVDALKIAIANTLNRADELTLDEQTKLLRVVEGIDKIARLDDGRATEIKGNSEKVIEVVNPFAGDDDEEEPEYKELS